MIIRPKSIVQPRYECGWIPGKWKIHFLGAHGQYDVLYFVDYNYSDDSSPYYESIIFKYDNHRYAYYYYELKEPFYNNIESYLEQEIIQKYVDLALENQQQWREEFDSQE